MKVDPSWLRRPEWDIAGADWEAYERPDGRREAVPCARKRLREDQIDNLARALETRILRAFQDTIDARFHPDDMKIIRDLAFKNLGIE